MNSEWQRCTVEELVNEGTLAPPLDGNHGAIHPKGSDFVPVGIPFIMASDMKNGLVDTTTCAFISSKQASTLRKGFAKQGDVLLSHKATIGRTAIVGQIDYEYLVLTPQVTYYRVLDPLRLNNRYLKYYFDSKPFQQTLAAWSGAGSTRAYLGITAQRKLPIALPPIALQNEIAEVIGALDDRIAFLRETNATLEAIAQALFKSWFVDFDPVRARQQGLAPEGMDGATAALFPDGFDESELGLVPKGWKVCAFTETIDVIGGGTPKTSVREYWNGELPWFSVADAPAKSDVYAVSTEKHISELGLANSSTKLLRVGTTIISARGTVGKLALTGCPMTMNQSCYALQGKAHDSYFTYFSTRRLVEALKQRAHGSVFDTITRDTLAGVSVTYPDFPVIQSFERVVQSVMERIRENLFQAQTLSTLRDTLLPRLISGQLRLPEAEAILEEVA